MRAGLVNCSRCGEPIQPGEEWDLDHRDDRRGYLGAAHSRCNRRAGAYLTNASRVEGGRWSRIWFEPSPPNVEVMS